jgi:hypothetical protein
VAARDTGDRAGAAEVIACLGLMIGIEPATFSAIVRLREGARIGETT